jgi:hypothetical protein
MHISRQAALWAVAFTGGALATFLALKRFEPWDQVMVLWDSGLSPILLIDNPHFFRFLVVYPGFRLEDQFPTIGFSIYVSLFFASNCLLWSRVSIRAIGGYPPLWGWIIFVSAHALMNGRGVLAWTAWLMCILVCLRMSRESVRWAKEIPKITVSCLLAAVSTGVFVIVFGAFFIFIARNLRARRRQSGRRRPILGPLVVLFVLGYFTQYFVSAIGKNLEFFGGGLTGALGMLEHGAGVLFTLDFVGLTVLAAALSVGVLLMLRLLFGKVLPASILLSLLPIVGGLFGFTVLTLCIPMVIVLIVSALRRRTGGFANLAHSELLGG